MDIEEYISSGIIESYVLGLVSYADEREVMLKATMHQEIADAIMRAEKKIEKLSIENAVPPPSGLWARIQNELV